MQKRRAPGPEAGQAVKKPGYSIDMVNGPLAGKLLLFALPLMLSSLLQLLFNAADVVVVGRYAGKEALAAVGSNGSLINLLVNLFIGFSVGANVVVARDLGSGRRDNAGKAVHTSIALSILSGLVMAAVGILLSPTLLQWMDSPHDVIDLSTLYLRVYFAGMPATMVYNFGSAMLRAQGDTKRPLYFLSIAGVINLILNLFFVISLHWGVAGVGAATAISQYVSAFLVLRCLRREDGPLHLEWRQLKLEWRVIRRIFEIGLPAGFQGIVFALSNVVIQSSINSFGSIVMGGSAAAASVEGFVYNGMNAFYQTALTFTSQNYGAGETKRADRVLLWCQIYVMITGLVLGNLAYLFGDTLVGFYVEAGPDAAAVIQQGVLRLAYVSIPYFLCGIMDTMVGSLRGLGCSVIPMIVSLLGSCVLRLVWVATIFQNNPSPEILYISYPVSWALTGSIHLLTWLYVRKKAYAKVSGAGPSYLKVDGHHPEAKAAEDNV